MCKSWSALLYGSSRIEQLNYAQEHEPDIARAGAWRHRDPLLPEILEEPQGFVALVLGLAWLCAQGLLIKITGVAVTLGVLRHQSSPPCQPAKLPKAGQAGQDSCTRLTNLRGLGRHLVPVYLLDDVIMPGSDARS